jgi:S-adenosylmethionine:tRNA ribosyltransferase-isomerase
VVVAVGTTVLRALEASRSVEPGLAAGGAKIGETTLFIKPPYKFDSVDALITNFHVPYSSLMMLVEAFLQYKKAPLPLVDLYKKAIAERMRFYSFGDAMLIL